jgi:hypothetical protein
VSRLCAMKLSSTLVFIYFLGNEDKISKSALEDNLFWFRIDCAAGISGVISPSSLIWIGLPHVQIEGIIDAHNFGSQTLVVQHKWKSLAKVHGNTHLIKSLKLILNYFQPTLLICDSGRLMCSLEG